MEKSTGFSQSAYGLIQFMGKRGRKHPHILYMCTDMSSHTRRRTNLCLLNVAVAGVQVYAVAQTPLFSAILLFESGPGCSHGHFRACACVCACAGNICAFWGPTHPPQQRSHEQGSSMCQHGASLTLGVLLKVLMEGALRRLCPLEPSCVSASPPLAVPSSLSVPSGPAVWIGQRGFAQPTWVDRWSGDSPASAAVMTGEALSAVAIRWIEKSQLFKFIIAKLVSVATSGVSL